MLLDFRNTSCTLVALVLLTIFPKSDSRFVLPGFSVRSSSEDLSVAAAEPRPIFEKGEFSEASEKVEKILHEPLAFSYTNTVPDVAATESRVAQVDQKPDAVDYYKYLKKIEADSDGGVAGQQLKSEEESVDHEDIQEESGEETEDHQAIQAAAHEDEHSDLADEDHGAVKGEEAQEDAASSEESSGDSQAENYEVHEKKQPAGGKEHGGGGGGGGHGHGTNSHGGGGHMEDGSFKKGGGKEYHSEQKGTHGEKGEKEYEGHHHDEKGNKGHHTKEGHENEDEESGGVKTEHHHDDGYHGEKHHGEEGEKGSEFHEDGEHSKGHSTKGEHNIRKKEEYEKKQEFFDEDGDEADFEKDGEYFHEDDFHKGGFEKESSKKEGEEENHYGKKNHHEKGGHYKDVKGHKDASGHDSHHDHVNKHGKKESHSGVKKWGYKEGTGGGHGGGGGGHKHGGGGGHKHGGGSGKYSVREKVDEDHVPIKHAESHAAPIHDHESIQHVADDGEKESAPIEGDHEEEAESNSELEESAGIENSDDGNEEGHESRGAKVIAKRNHPRKFEASVALDNEALEDEKYEISNVGDTGSDEVGAYKVYLLGDYKIPKSSPSTQSCEDMSIDKTHQVAESRTVTRVQENLESESSDDLVGYADKMSPIIVADLNDYI